MASVSRQAPDGTKRLFPERDAALLEALTGGVAETGAEPADAADFVIGRLLEEGDSDDLRWLVASLSEERLSDWLERRGTRQLSRRSYLFWRALIGAGSQATEPHRGLLREALWPL